MLLYWSLYKNITFFFKNIRKIRMIDSNTITCSVKGEDTIANLKQKIFTTIGFTVNQQHLFQCETKEHLNDNQRRLSTYCIEKGSDSPQVELRVPMYVCIKYIYI